MSGIVGIIGGADRALLERLTDCLACRGPDGRAVWCADGVGLGHAWFDTARESAGREPPCTLDNQTFIVADARLDGRAELLRQLRDRGAACADDATDAELLLHAYRAWGEACVTQLLGDFAFAIWDAPRGRLFAARDHFGVKPFFFAVLDEGLLFGNTLNCLRRHPEVSERLNELAVADHLLFGLNHDPATTTFADIQRLPPAHVMMWSGDRPHTRRYWSLPTAGSITYRDERDYIDEFRALLRTAVADRLPAGNVAISMSGGLDSTALAALTQEVLAGRPNSGKLHAFTVVYDRLVPDEERHYSGLAAEALGVPIRYLAADDYLPFRNATDSTRPLPEPVDDPFLAMTFDHLDQAAAHGRVALSGDGGDAVFYASPNYMMSLLRQLRWGRWLGEVTRFLRAQRRLPPLGLRSWLKRRVGIRPPASPFPAWLNPEFVARLGLRERWTEVNRQPAPAHVGHAEAHRLLSAPYWTTVFEGFDPGTTSINLEIRYPFFDVRLVNFVLAIPSLPWCADKWVLRAALRGRLPDAIRLRPKRPLGGNPLVALCDRGSCRWSDHLEDMRQLAPYVTSEGIRQSADSQPLNPWLTRPISLLNWLDCLTTPTTVIEREKHDDCTRIRNAQTSLPTAPSAGVWNRP